MPLEDQQDELYELFRTIGDRVELHRKSISMELSLYGQPTSFSLWFDEVQAQAVLDTSEAAADCVSFLSEASDSKKCYIFKWPKSNPPRSLIVILQRGNVQAHDKTVDVRLRACSEDSSDAGERGQSFIMQRLAKMRKSRRNLQYSMLVIVSLFFATLVAVPFLPPRAVFTRGLKQQGTHYRYPTPGSEGPKNQIHITFDNALEWGKDHPHQHGEWRVRMDDQAVVPAELWDEDEDFYQTWYYDRYPHMSKIIHSGDHLRPSWLGSLGTIVAWDTEFHYNHCIVALRRYWKAKETGRHVCPRDIDHEHIKHCLNWLDGKNFGSKAHLGKDAGLGAGNSSMIWQTKACF